MKTLHLLTPKSELLPNVVSDALCLASAAVPADLIMRWTPNERLLAYDWAMREHFHASGNGGERRAKPSFVTDAEDLAKQRASGAIEALTGRMLQLTEPVPGSVASEMCRKSKRADGQHGWVFGGDDPYVVCTFCTQVRDALSGSVVRAGL